MSKVVIIGASSDAESRSICLVLCQMIQKAIQVPTEVVNSKDEAAGHFATADYLLVVEVACDAILCRRPPIAWSPSTIQNSPSQSQLIAPSFYGFWDCVSETNHQFLFEKGSYEICFNGWSSSFRKSK